MYLTAVFRSYFADFTNKTYDQFIKCHALSEIKLYSTNNVKHEGGF